MINFINNNEEAPYVRLRSFYNIALEANQKNIEAIAISSYSKVLNEVNSRFVNLKFVDNKELIFFSNYTSALVNCLGCFSSLVSSLSNKLKASAVAPAKTAITLPSPILRTF